MRQQDAKARGIGTDTAVEDAALVAAQPSLETVREGTPWRTRLKGKPAAKKAAPKPATAKAATARTSAKKAAS